MRAHIVHVCVLYVCIHILGHICVINIWVCVCLYACVYIHICGLHIWGVYVEYVCVVYVIADHSTCTRGCQSRASGTSSTALLVIVLKESFTNPEAMLGVSKLQ